MTYDGKDCIHWGMSWQILRSAQAGGPSDKRPRDRDAFYNATGQSNRSRSTGHSVCRNPYSSLHTNLRDKMVRTDRLRSTRWVRK